MRICWRMGAALMAIGVLGPAARAQQPSAARDSARQDRIRADSVQHAAHRLAAVVVTGTRLTNIDERTPTQVEHLSLEHVPPGPEAATASLQQLPGISLYDDQGTPLQPELDVRGFTVSPIAGTPQGVSVFLDGVRVNEPDAQEVNFDLLPMAAVDHASLVRGSEAIFGRNSLGGALLLFTRRGTAAPSVHIELAGGSFGDEVGTISAQGMLHGIDGYLMATGSQQTGWRDKTGARTRMLFATIGHRTAGAPDSGDVALSVLYAHDRISEAGSLPESYLNVDPRINYTPGDFFAPDLLQLSLRGSRALAGGTVRGTVFGRRNNYEQYNVNIPPPSSDDFIRNQSLGGTIEWTRPTLLGAVPIAFTAGIEYARQDVHFRLLAVGVGAPDSVATLAGVHEDDAAAYGQAIATVTPRLSATAALRADYVRIPYRDALDAANSATSTYDRLSPLIGLTYRFSDALRGYVAYKSGFRAPASLELACASPDAPCSLPSALGADPALQPVTTRDYEAGFDVDLPYRSSLDVNGFWTDVDNDILFAAPNLTQVYFVNVPHTRRAGIEVAGQIGLPAGARLFGSYSYVAATFQSTIQIATADTSPRPARPGDIFPSSPLHRGRVGVGITRVIGSAAFDAQMDVRTYSSQYLRGDESNQHAPVPGYAVAGIEARAEVGRYTIGLTVDNLFDRRYETFGVLAANSLGPPGSTMPQANPPIVRFLTPGLPRRIVVSIGARM